MTQQYLPEEINQVGYFPVNVTTPDDAVLDVVLGTLSANNSTLTLQLHGGGAAPSDITNYAYTAQGVANAVRDAAGALSVIDSTLNTRGVGLPTLTLVIVGNNVVLRIAPTPGSPAVNHRLQAIINIF